MDAKTIIDQTEKYYLPVFGRYQLALTHGKGCKLYDADGNEYLDFLAGIAVNSLGHAHPALVKLLVNRLRNLCTALIFTILIFRQKLLKKSLKLQALTGYF